MAGLHSEFYKKASESMLIGGDKEYYVCNICGYIAEDEIPQKWPVCGAVNTRFQGIS